MACFDGDLGQWVPTMGDMAYLQISICDSAFHFFPLVTFWVKSCDVSVWLPDNISLHNCSDCICIYTGSGKGEGTGTVHSHEVKTKCWIFQIWLLCVISQLTPGNMQMRSYQNVLQPIHFIQLLHSLSFIFDEITLGGMKSWMLTEPSLALLLDQVQEIRVASWLWTHTFRLSLCLPALSCHM